MSPDHKPVTGPPGPGAGAFDWEDLGEPTYVMAIPEGGSVVDLIPADLADPAQVGRLGVVGLGFTPPPGPGGG